MKVFTRDYRIEHYDAQLYSDYFNGMKPCVLDIEATGLSPARSKLVLMGLLTETAEGLRVTQFLAENHYEENRVLDATLEFLRDEGINYIITFNGLRYDVPFINTRLELLGYEERLRMYDFDLYRFLRKCTSLPKEMESLSQAAVEARFGIAKDRQDTISGRESVALFDEYALSGNSTVEKIILTHNREDVLQLYRLMKLAGRDDFRDILPAANCGFEAKPSGEAGEFGEAGSAANCAIGENGVVSGIETPAEAGSAANCGIDETGENGEFGEAGVFRIKDAAAGLCDNAAFHGAIAKFGFPLLKGRLSARPKLNVQKKELRISGDQIFDAVSAAYFPDIDNPITAIFNSSTSSYEITLPIEAHAGGCYVDLNKLPAIKERVAPDDPDIVNDYLILNSRTVNMLSTVIVENFV